MNVRRPVRPRHRGCERTPMRQAGDSPQALRASAAQTISNVSQTDTFIKYDENGFLDNLKT